MWIWWLMLACDLIVPVTMILVGRMMRRHAPKEINMTFGYRTKRSMQNEETWKFAHDFCGRLWWKTGWVLGAVTVIFQIALIRSDENTISSWGIGVMLVQTAVMLLTILPVERALKRTFGDPAPEK